MKRSLFIVIAICWMPCTFYGWTWKDVWFTPDQQAQQLMQQKQYKKAAALFTDSQWQASAFYRNKAYEKAAPLFQNLKNADGYYNLGNALAQLGQFQKAITAYDQALSLEPKHKDAQFNRQLVKSLLKQQEQKKQQDKEQGKGKQQGQEKEQEQGKQGGEQNADNPSQSKNPANPSESEANKNSTKNKKTQTQQNSPQEEAATKEHQNTQQSQSSSEEKRAKDQWLRLIPDEPGGLMREKFLRDYLRRQKGWAQ